MLPADEPAPRAAAAEPGAPRAGAEELAGDDELWKSINLEKSEGVGEVELEHGDDETRPR